MSALYLIRVMRILKRPLTAVERDTVLQFFEAGYSVNYTVEYLR